MLSGLFRSTTIPVLEEAFSFAQARHTVLAGNIANLDTPGYQVRDLSTEDFHERLKAAIEGRGDELTLHSPGMPPDQRPDDLAQVAENTKTVLRHDGVNVSMEHQVTEMIKNQAQHNLALTVMIQQFRLLQAAISERV